MIRLSNNRYAFFIYTYWRIAIWIWPLRQGHKAPYWAPWTMMVYPVISWTMMDPQQVQQQQKQVIQHLCNMGLLLAEEVVVIPLVLLTGFFPGDCMSWVISSSSRHFKDFTSIKTHIDVHCTGHCSAAVPIDFLTKYDYTQCSFCDTIIHKKFNGSHPKSRPRAHFQD